MVEPMSLERVLLEVYQVFQVTRDASFIDALALKDDDKPRAKDAGSLPHKAEIADTTTLQVCVAPATAASSPPPVKEKNVCINPLNLCQFDHTML